MPLPAILAALGGSAAAGGAAATGATAAGAATAGGAAAAGGATAAGGAAAATGGRALAGNLLKSSAKNYAVNKLVNRSTESNGHSVSSSQFPPAPSFAPSPNSYVDNEAARW